MVMVEMEDEKISIRPTGVKYINVFYVLNPLIYDPFNVFRLHFFIGFQSNNEVSDPKKLLLF